MQPRARRKKAEDPDSHLLKALACVFSGSGKHPPEVFKPVRPLATTTLSWTPELDNNGLRVLKKNLIQHKESLMLQDVVHYCVTEYTADSAFFHFSWKVWSRYELYLTFHSFCFTFYFKSYNFTWFSCGSHICLTFIQWITVTVYEDTSAEVAFSQSRLILSLKD